MSRRVTLYIGGLKADLPDESPIQFNWTREELDNPTVVRNSYTQQLTLPGTPANDAIFGHFGRVERATQALLGETTGAYYNPLKKADFALYADDMTVLARGYVKLEQITSRGDQATSYKISLYGGLGSLFYDLSFNPDGSERTLADLTYKDSNDADVDPYTETMSVDRLTVAAMWGASILTPVPDWNNILTFAPFYNGVPSGDFDANKAIVSTTSYYNFPQQAGYTPLAGSYGNNPILALFTNKHTEWEMRDFRAYLQRPVVSVKAVIEALTDPSNTGDWTLALDGSFFSAGTNPWYDEAWMTLPLLQRPEDGDWTALTLSDALEGGGMSPASFLIGYAKMFGLVFHVDESTQTVTLMARDDYYAIADTVDLTERVDIDSVSIKPCNASARWYEMKATEVDAEYTKEYEATWGRVYGSQRIDTGWEFDSAVKDLLPSFPFKGAADVLETSPNFYLNWYNSRAGLAVVDNEAVKYRLYDGSGNAQDFEAYIGQWVSKTVYYYNTLDTGFDFCPKVQLHGAENKASDGSGVLLIKVGEETLPNTMNWHVSDDDQDMLDLNDGRPCWQLAGDTTSVSKIPLFRRMAGAQTMDFGAPREIAVPNETTSEGASVYYNRWKGYLADRLDVDTKVLTCKVDWRGHQVGAGLLRNFYWWRNTLWSLNKIKNYAPTVDGLTECEFVLVKDHTDYDAGQDVPAMSNWYLNLSPGSLNFNSAGDTLTITITANVSWTLSVPAWITASSASGTGNATVTLTAGTNTGSDRSGTVSMSGDHATSASASAYQAANFTPSIAVTPTSKSIDNKARTFYYSITCNGAWRVKSISVAWLTCTSTGNGNGTATIGIAANTGDSSRTGSITFEMTDYPATTCTTYIIQAAPAAEMTYALELSSASQTLPASGGSYTLVVTGVTYENGVEKSRAVLDQSALAFTKSGSAALSRAGLTFSAADLAFTQTAEQTAVWTVYWNANGASATFTCKQEANVRSVIARQEEGTFPYVPATVTWNDSQVNEALAAGDVMYLNPTFHYEQTVTVTYTSRPGDEFYENAQADVDGAVQVVSGTGLSVSGSGTAWTVTWAQNTGGTTRSGVLKIKQTGTNPYYPGYFYDETRTVTQAVASGIPSKLLISHEEGGQTVYVETAGKDVYGTYVRWYIGLDAYGHPVYVYTDLTPDRGDNVYNESTLQTVYGTILDIVY